MHTEVRTNSKTSQVLNVMRLLTWIAFIGLMIKAGAFLVAVGVNFMHPQAAGNLYPGLNFLPLLQFNPWHYILAVLLQIALTSMQAIVLLLLIKALSKVNLENPFSTNVVGILGNISGLLLGIALVAISQNAHADWLFKRTGFQLEKWATGEFIFMAGLVFIISQVFKRGVEIQAENDLTV